MLFYTYEFSKASVLAGTSNFWQKRQPKIPVLRFCNLKKTEKYDIMIVTKEVKFALFFM